MPFQNLMESYSQGQDGQLHNKLYWAEVEKAFLDCPCSQSPINMTWTMWPVGGQRKILIKSDDSKVNSNYITEDCKSKNVSIIDVKKVLVSTAGVYNCEQDTTKSAQFIVIVEGTMCSINPKSTEARSLRESTPQSLSCTMKFAANASYVSANMSWSIRGGTSEPPRGSMEQSTSANITELRSTLNVTVPENDTCFVSIYECHATFSLKDNLPSGFATNAPRVIPSCSPNSRICGLERTSEKPVDKSDKEPTKKPTNKPTKRPTKRPTYKPTKRPTKKPDKEKDKEPKISGEDDEDYESEGGVGSSIPRSDGLAVKSSKGNDILKCVVGIAGFLLIIVTGIGV